MWDYCLVADLAEQEAIEKIDEVQNEIDRLNEQASEEILKVCVYVYINAVTLQWGYVMYERVWENSVDCATLHPEMFSRTLL